MKFGGVEGNIVLKRVKLPNIVYLNGWKPHGVMENLFNIQGEG